MSKAVLWGEEQSRDGLRIDRYWRLTAGQDHPEEFYCLRPNAGSFCWAPAWP